MVWVLEMLSRAPVVGQLGHEFREASRPFMDGYFDQGAHHLNVTASARRSSSTPMEHPEKEEYANFTIHSPGYAVKFTDLTREQQMDVISVPAMQLCNPIGYVHRWRLSVLWTVSASASSSFFGRVRPGGGKYFAATPRYGA